MNELCVIRRPTSYRVLPQWLPSGSPHWLCSAATNISKMTRPGEYAPCPGSSQPLLASTAPLFTTTASPSTSTSTTTPSPQLRVHPGRRRHHRRPCLSAVWSTSAEPTLLRRAVHSWSGYGTLDEVDETPSTPTTPIHSIAISSSTPKTSYGTLNETDESPTTATATAISDSSDDPPTNFLTPLHTTPISAYSPKSSYGTLNELDESPTKPTSNNISSMTPKSSYGALNETDDTPNNSPGSKFVCTKSSLTSPDKQEHQILQESEEDTVADSAALLQPRARRLGTALAPAHLPGRNGTQSGSNSTIFSMPGKFFSFCWKSTNLFVWLVCCFLGIKNLVSRRRETTSPSGTSAPLVRRDSCSLARLSSDPSGSFGSPSSALHTSTTSLTSGIRKCETVLALTGLGAVLKSATSSGGGNLLTPPTPAEAVQPVNRLRVSPGSLRGSTSRLCSRCSSLLSLAATSGSRYSLNTTTGGFVPVVDDPQVLCKLCLAEVPSTETFPIQHCSCSFCNEVCQQFYDGETSTRFAFEQPYFVQLLLLLYS